MSEFEMIEKEGLDGKKVKILGASYEKGGLVNGQTYQWKKNLGADREQVMKYITESERYWYLENGFGSEKRKNPA